MNRQRRAAIVEAVIGELGAADDPPEGALVQQADQAKADELGRVLQETCAWDDHDVEMIVKTSLPVPELSPAEVEVSLGRVFAGR